MKCLSAIFLAGMLSQTLLLQTHSAGAVTESVVVSFGGADGSSPYGGVLGVKDKLYVATSNGGENGFGYGTIVSYNIKKATTTLLYSFGNRDSDGQQPEASLIDINNTLFGTTVEGGAGDGGNGAGTVYSWDIKKRKEKVLYSFCEEKNCADGAMPESTLIPLNGLLYGTTYVGGIGGCDGPYLGCGTVFSLDPATGAEQVVYAFCAAEECADGEMPVAGLIQVNGILYGTTGEGGNQDLNCYGGCGTVFALDPANGTETVVHAFDSVDGALPQGGLLNVNGMLYGTTYWGGAGSCSFGCGIVYSVDPATGAETVLHSFNNNGKDGQYPLAGLTEMKGILYGTTEYGGANGDGTVFRLNPTTGAYKVLYSFCSQQNCADGEWPYASLTDVNGTLYGTTESGGNGGTVFAIKP